jgi:hypothetical protein
MRLLPWCFAGVIVNGRRPPKPEFTITNPKGETVQEGSFSYG